MARKKRPTGRPVSASVRYREIAAELRGRLRSGEFPTGTALPSLRRLAREYHTSDFTVRMAVDLLKCEGRIRANARHRLIATRNDRSAGSLDGLVLLVSDLPLDRLQNDPYFDQLLRGVHIGTGQLNASFMAACNPCFRNSLPLEALELPLRGVVLCGNFTARVLREYEKLSVPVVFPDHLCTKRKLHSIAVDNFASAREAARRLIALGHRRIGFIRFVQLGMKRVDPDALERQEGFFAALREAGLPASAGVVFNSFEGDTPESPSIRAIFRRHPPVTAMLSASGGRAELVATAAGKKGKKIPRDISIVCFQGTQASYPRLSGPRVDFEDMGRRAIELLAAPKHPPQRVLMPAIWTEAGSTGQAPE